MTAYLVLRPFLGTYNAAEAVHLLHRVNFRRYTRRPGTDIPGEASWQMSDHALDVRAAPYATEFDGLDEAVGIIETSSPATKIVT